MRRERVRIKQLKELLRIGIAIAEAAVEENAQLRKRAAELEEICKNSSEVEHNLHQQIAELKEKKPVSLKKRLVKLFS